MAKHLYKVIFINHDQVYEIFAKNFCESEVFGFVEVEGLVFGETTTLLVDPNEERLKREFQGVERFFIPSHAVVRVDLVANEGTAKIHDIKTVANVSQFPFVMKPKSE